MGQHRLRQPKPQPDQQQNEYEYNKQHEFDDATPSLGL
jgi:hypothetical protein